MSETGDRFREDTLAAQAEEDRDGTQEELEALYEWARRNVDYLTDVCLGPVTRVILDRWEQGGTEPPWTDAGKTGEDQTSSEEERAA